MRSQLNPHFILNTVHALMGLVRREPAVAEEALEPSEEAHAALRLQPEWVYVRDVLLPKIEAARKAG